MASWRREFLFRIWPIQLAFLRIYIVNDIKVVYPVWLRHCIGINTAFSNRTLGVVFSTWSTWMDWPVGMPSTQPVCLLAQTLNTSQTDRLHQFCFEISLSNTVRRSVSPVLRKLHWVPECSCDTSLVKVTLHLQKAVLIITLHKPTTRLC